MGKKGKQYLTLFETKRAKGRIKYRLFSVSIFVGICLILVYRVNHIPNPDEDGRWVWIGLDCLYEDHDLPGVDIFVCTADPTIEPPKMVINTVLSVMAYDYPPEKLSVNLSDHSRSEITFYALLEASKFAKYWLPYCSKFAVEPRSRAAFFSSMPLIRDAKQASEFVNIKKLYEDMENFIEIATKLGQIQEEERSKHKGFSHWDSYSSRLDHDTLLQILIDGTDPNSTDAAGCILPTLVYLAREKRPQHPHNFKAGAMNALIRVSSKISNGKIILNMDCDMYSNNSKSIRDALCFFMDEEEGHKIAYVQFAQAFEDITKNELYSGSYRIVFEVEFNGLDGYGGPIYSGTGCFNRRDILCGRKLENKYKIEEKKENVVRRSVCELEEESKILASCTYEKNTTQGKEKGLKYNCLVEDAATGLSIQFQGWKSVYFNPSRPAFIGLTPTTLLQTFVQQKRWCADQLQLGYCCYGLWAPSCLPTLYYSIVPSLYLLKGIPLFPKILSPWFMPFPYVVIAKYTYSLAEFLHSRGTILDWWNDQRIWLYKRVCSYLFGFIDNILNLLGFSESGFVITSKVANEHVFERYEKEIMEFGSQSPMFTLLAALALLNLYSFFRVVKEVVAVGEGAGRFCEEMFFQIVLCLVLILINLPLYRGLFLRQDKGKMPTSLTVKAVGFASLVCTCVALY
ncbi:hypothetical protein UlMin_003873 [Ulmus minor]